MPQLTADDVCTATGGTLACGRTHTVFTSVSIDSRAVSPGALFIPLPGSRTDGHDHIAAAVQRGAAGFLFAAGRAPALHSDATGIAVRDPLTALQALSAWHRSRLRARVIGIAGSNGKTTTKELLAQVCAANRRTLATLGNQNNHIGLPLTLLRADERVEVMVLELGTSGAGELTLLSSLARPQIGVITAIAEEHTETLHDLAGVIAAETELIAALPADGVAVVNGDDAALLAAVRRLARCRVVTFGQGAEHPYRAADIRVSRQGTSFTACTPVASRQVRLRLLGSHFALAALASIAVAAECGLSLDDTCTALAVAHGAPHRMAVVEVPALRLTVLDDCYNANPASVRQALLTATQVRREGERFVAVLGDMLELGALSRGRHEEIGEYLTTLAAPPDLLVTVGECTRGTAARAGRAGIPVRSFATAEAAARFVRADIRAHDGPQLLLVKGSRGAHLEAVVRHVTTSQPGE
ncbi:MAG: UDP-N-acetylmuramoyl-tripeptide--D-alanyl-D-alanine ligase [Thermodesulfobacteriota bacterium]